MKKRRQHYVWEHYLTAWARDGQLWCLRNGRRFRTSTANVANRRDFYRLKELTLLDLEYVEAVIIRQVQADLQAMARGWVSHFTAFFVLKRLQGASGERHPELELALDEVINNLEENLHASAEAKALPIIAELRDGNMSVFADERRFASFAWFIALQYLRTPRFAIGMVEK